MAHQGGQVGVSTTTDTKLVDPAVLNKGAQDQTPPQEILSRIAVVKRNGSLVPFRSDRISNAIESAFRSANKIPRTAPLPQEIYSAVHKVADSVVRDIANQALGGASLTVEGIQDAVEVKLMESGYYDIARTYIIYRDEHKTIREDSVRNIKILRRDGKTRVRFNPMKIASAIEKAFRATLGITETTPQETIDAVGVVTTRVVNRAKQLSAEGIELHVEMIQDEVEREMMAAGYYNVAKDFILYRAERSRARAQQTRDLEGVVTEAVVPEEQRQISLDIDEPGRTFAAVDKNGRDIKITEGELRKKVAFAVRGFEKLVNAEEIVEDAVLNFYEGIKEHEVDKAVLMASRSKVERDPAYSFVTSRLLLDVIYRETFDTPADDAEFRAKHRAYFKEYLKKAIDVERLNPELLNFDLDRLSDAMDINRDLKFTHLGLQTLYDRYLIHHEDVRIETPQIFWMRVAMGLCMNEGEQKNERAIEFYDVLSQFLFVSSTPTLFNSGTTHPQMSSCYLSTVMDDLTHIFKVISDDARLSKWAGGLGNDWTNVRATGSRIKGTNGRSQGVIPFLKVANDTAVAVNQGGKRKGAMCAYLETWHLDMEDFLELRKNTGDERRRTHDMNTANWIPDLFMKRVEQSGSWTLFSPSDVPDLHDLYGKEFEKRYEEYEQMAENGEITLFKKVEAVSLWRKMLSMLFETGHPWLTFKDPSNIRSPQDHTGVVHSSNLCTEILLNTTEEETAVCNLGSLNLAAHTAATGLRMELLAATVKTAIRMLDNVIDLNYYPTPEAKNANMRHRPIGLGLMGFQDALYVQRIGLASPEAVEFADRSMEAISYYAILSSSELAKERGTYSTYKGSKWDRGLLPVDTLELLSQERGAEWVELDQRATMDWSIVRRSVKEHGMRNSNTMAIAPTATISNISGVTQSIEPTYKHLFAKSNLSGEFIIHNPHLVDELKKLDLWDDEMIDDLKYFDGSITEIDRIPDELKRMYPTAFEVDPEWLIECASRRQKWIDMGQSLNLYLAEPSGKKLHDMYMHAWKLGLKTTYYLRSLGATQIEKSTLDINRRGLQPRWMKNKSASADIVVDRAAEKEAAAMPGASCNLDGDCEACQ